MKNASPTKTPIAKKPKKASEEEDSENYQETVEEGYPYREVVGSLLYLSSKTRPDMSFAVNYASRYTSNPTKEHIINIKRTLRYLKGSAAYGLKYLCL